ncbi:hypothetical protein SALBM217S_05084 [Streptomyces griseoloalbus]
MSPIRHARRPRLATAGAAVTGAVLLAAALTPTTAGAADRPTRAATIDAAASVLADRADALGLTAAQDTTVRDVAVDADGSRSRKRRGVPGWTSATAGSAGATGAGQGQNTPFSSASRR